MKRYLFSFLPLGLLLSLCACAHFGTDNRIYYSGHTPRYLDATSHPALMIPPGMNERKISASFPIPLAPEPSHQVPSLVPPGSLAATVDNSNHKRGKS